MADGWRIALSPLYDHELSMRERQIMDAVHALGRATVQEVTDRLPDAPTANAVRTMLGNLTKKGYLRQSRDGRRAVYAPRSPRGAAARRALDRVLSVFYAGSMPDALRAYFSDPRVRLSDDELAEIERLLNSARDRSRNDD